MVNIPIISDVINTGKNAADVAQGFGAILGDLIFIVRNIVEMIRNPFKFAIMILIFIIGTCAYVVLKLLHFLIGLPPFFIRFYPIFHLIYYLPTYVVMLLFTLVYAFLAAVALVLAVIDVVTAMITTTARGKSTAGVLSYLMRCENHIDAWYTQPNVAFKNVSDRMILARKPCVTRYKPDGMFACARQHASEPSYCPQSQIFRIFMGMPVYDPWIIDAFEADRTFYQSPPAKREKIVKDFFHRRQMFLQTCAAELKPYHGLIRSVCANCDTIPLEKENEEARAMLPKLCRQVFCEGEFPEPYCGKFKDRTDGVAYPDASDIAYTMFKYGGIVVLGTIILIFFLRTKT
jgi:hypothetical protein